MMEIRSYRRVFDLERRIYRVDRLRLNPGGVPVRGVVYFLVILAGALIAARLPLLSVMAKALPWYVRDLMLPAASATVLSMIRVEGRPFHVAAHALARYGIGPRRLAGVRRCAAPGERWAPGQIVMLPDGSDSRMRSLRYTGPGAVLVAVEHERTDRAPRRTPASVRRGASRPDLTLRQLPQGRELNRAQVIVLARGARLLIRSDTAGGG
jgi:hypothetical protein